jgi:uncharacterized protein
MRSITATCQTGLRKMFELDLYGRPDLRHSCGMVDSDSVYEPGPTTRIRRKDRAIGAASFVQQVIDESLIAHVAFCTPDGVPQCLPMAFARVDDVLYFHGAVANGLLRGVVGARCSITFTLLDGLVFARSAFHHSMNYRCVVAVGNARRVDDEQEKREALVALVEHVAKGRSQECIGMTDSEVRSTLVVAIDVKEAAAKQRKGPPVDDTEHVELGQHFAGVLPLALRAGAVERDVPSLAVPESINQRARELGSKTICEVTRGDVLYSSDPSRIDFDWAHLMLSTRAYWALGLGREALVDSWNNSLVFGAYLGGCQIACARVLTDGSRIGYLGDVFVDPAHRGRGYGQALVQFLMGHPVVARCERVLLGTKDAQTLYRRFGFADSSNSYMVKSNAERVDQ